VKRDTVSPAEFRARLRESAPHYPSVPAGSGAKPATQSPGTPGVGRGTFNPLEDGRVWTREELGIDRVERRRFWRSVGRWCLGLLYVAAFLGGLAWVAHITGGVR
jgi:hypothetical protein